MVLNDHDQNLSIGNESLDAGGDSELAKHLKLEPHWNNY